MSSSGTDTASRPSTASSSKSAHGKPQIPPSDDDIEAVIKQATSSRPSPSGGPLPGKDTRTQLFVGNLPYRVRWQDLKDLFRKAGTVLRADVSLAPDNRSRGYGTVLLSTAEDAGRAVDMFNGYTWQTRTLEVRLDRLPPDFDAPPSNQHIMTGATGTPVNGTFHNHSPMNTIPFMSPATASFLSVPGVTSHFEGALDYILDRPKTSAPGSGRTLFVGNLPFHCQWQDLKDLFRQAGTILRADVSLGPDGRSRGFGTVTFANDIDAERAVHLFNGYDYNGRTLKVHHDKFAQMPSLPVSTSTSPLPPSQQHHPFVVQHNNVNVFLPHPLGPQYGHTPAPGSPFLVQQNSPVPPRPVQPAPVHATASNNASALDNLVKQDNSSPTDRKFQNTSLSPRDPSSSSGSSGNSHPAHPGPISLPPPPPPGTFPIHSAGPLSPISPLHHPLLSLNGTSGPGHAMNMTPHGLPPITPSMPSFTFIQQQSPSSQQNVGRRRPGPMSSMNSNNPQTPHHHPNHPAQHILGPFSPGMTPGAFWGPPGHAASNNPYLNPAVGSPVLIQLPLGSPGGYYDLGQQTPHAMPGTGMGMDEPRDYFPPVQSTDSGVPASMQDIEYFPVMGGASSSRLGSSLLANEILRNERNGGGLRNPDELMRTRSNSGSVPSEAGTDLGLRGSEGGDLPSSSSLATSWRSLSDENMDVATQRFSDMSLRRDERLSFSNHSLANAQSQSLYSMSNDRLHATASSPSLSDAQHSFSPPNLEHKPQSDNSGLPVRVTANDPLGSAAAFFAGGNPDAGNLAITRDLRELGLSPTAIDAAARRASWASSDPIAQQMQRFIRSGGLKDQSS